MSDQLNSSGPISLGGSTAGESINLELDASATAAVSMNDTALRKLGGVVSSGSQISMSQFYGRSKYATIDFSNQLVYPNNVVSQFSLDKYFAGRIGDGYSSQSFGNYNEAVASWTGTDSFTFSFNTAGGRGLYLVLGIAEGFSGSGTSYFKVWVSNGASTTRTITARPSAIMTTFPDPPVQPTISDVATTISTSETNTSSIALTSVGSNYPNYQICYGFEDAEGGIPTDWIGATLHGKYVAPTGDNYTYNINLT